MNLTIVSHFRNSARYIPEYINRVSKLETLFNLSLVLGYGDSRDNTEALLHEECVNRFDSYLIDVSHGGHLYGSVVHPERFKQLAGVGNKLWGNIPKSSDMVALIESDLAWEPQSLSNVVEGVRSLERMHGGMILLAPMIHHVDGRFYDTWAFRRNGIRFTNEPPFHADFPNSPRYLEMDSVGSFVVMRGEVARRLHWPEKDVVVGFCRLAKEMGAKVFVDTQEKVYHP